MFQVDVIGENSTNPKIITATVTTNYKPATGDGVGFWAPLPPRCKLGEAEGDRKGRELSLCLLEKGDRSGVEPP